MLLGVASLLMMALTLLKLLVEPLARPSDRVEHGAENDERRDHCCRTGEAWRDDEVAQRHRRLHCLRNVGHPNHSPRSRSANPADPLMAASRSNPLHRTRNRSGQRGFDDRRRRRAPRPTAGFPSWQARRPAPSRGQAGRGCRRRTTLRRCRVRRARAHRSRCGPPSPARREPIRESATRSPRRPPAG